MKNPVFVRSLIAVGIAVIIVAGAFLIVRKDDSSSVPQPQIKTAEEKVPSKTTKTYTEEAGFSFNYPDDLTVAKKESTNSAVYSSLEIISKEVAGSMTFLIEDTKFKSVDELIKKNIATKEAMLGSLKAIETTYGNKTTLLAVDQGILFRADLDRATNKSYWDSIYQTFLSGFSFANTQSSSVSEDSYGGEEVVLEEDVIE